MGGEGSCIRSDRYIYTHDEDDSHHAVHAHHVTLLTANNNNNNNNNAFLFYFSAFSISSAAAFSLYLHKGESIYIPLWSLIIGALLVKKVMGNNVEKESIIIMRAFGVQLVTHYKSGRKVHRFFPMDKILKPVLNECVTPVTCYWSLSLIVSGEEELVLVFKGMRPPLKMLIPIWKALCVATTCSQTLDEIR